MLRSREKLAASLATLRRSRTSDTRRAYWLAYSGPPREHAAGEKRRTDAFSLEVRGERREPATARHRGSRAKRTSRAVRQLRASPRKARRRQTNREVTADPEECFPGKRTRPVPAAGVILTSPKDLSRSAGIDGGSSREELDPTLGRSVLGSGGQVKMRGPCSPVSWLGRA